MGDSVTSSTFTVDRLVSICHGTGELFVQQTEKILSLFKQISEDLTVSPNQVSHLSWRPVFPSFFSEEGWRVSSSSNADIAFFWEKGQESLALQYDMDKNLTAQVQKEGKIINISPEYIYIQWGKPFEELTPKLYWEGETCQLYMFDCLGENAKIFFNDKPETDWTDMEIKRVTDSLKYYLKDVYQSRILSIDKALQFRECCDAVCRIIHPLGTGTGFVIGNRLLITSHHILKTAGECREARAEFFYDSYNSEPVVVSFDPDTFFVTSKSPATEEIELLSEDSLDFTLVALHPHPQLENVFAHPIRLDKSEPGELGKRVLLIHHPGGKEKKVHLAQGRNSRILRIEPLYLIHTVDTDLGSSGAPLLSSSLKIMGLHRQTLKESPRQKIAVKTEAICSYLQKYPAGNSHWKKILAEFGPKESSPVEAPNFIYTDTSIPLPPKDFTGREKELTRLYETFQHSSRVAVTGLGGTGKTTLALKYAEIHKSEYQFIYFMPSGSTQLIIQGLIQLADNLAIHSHGKVENRLQLLKIKLDRLVKKGLLIFDGVDRVEAFYEIERYLPLECQHILLTSRMPGEARIRNFEQIDLGPLLPDDAIDYLLRVTQSKEKEKARELSEKLGNFPLALTQAAGYIRHLKIDIQKYIEQLDTSDVKLFKDEKTILTAWKISLDEIEKTPSGIIAKKILNFFAFLGQAPIPLSLIENWLKTFYSESSELDLLDALAQLCDYSMIDRSRSQDDTPYFEAYNIHLLVQNVTRYQLLPEIKQEIFEQALKSLAIQMAVFNSKNLKDWAFIRVLVPHSEIIIQHAEKFQLSQKIIPSLAALSDSVGKWLVVQGNASKALKYFNIALKFREKLLVKSDTDTAIIYNNIGLSLRELGRYQEALENAQKALAISLKIFGEKPSDTAASYVNVSLSLRALGRHQEALENAQKALAISLKIFGEKHPMTAASYSNFGSSLGELGRHQEALEYKQKALEIMCKIFGEEHPDTAATYGNIASSLGALGRHQEALENAQKALEISHKIFGEEHPMTAVSYNNIGSSLRALGRHQEALENVQKVLEIRRKIFGEEHPDTAAGYNNFGSLLGELGRNQEALEYQQKALEIRHKVLGKEHPDTAISYNNVGEIWRKLGKLEKAPEYQLRGKDMSIGQPRVGTPSFEVRLSDYYRRQENHPSGLGETLEDLRQSIPEENPREEEDAQLAEFANRIMRKGFNPDPVIEVRYGKKDGPLLFTSDGTGIPYESVSELVKEEEYRSAEVCFENFKKVDKFFREKFSIHPCTDREMTKIVVCVYTKKPDGRPTTSDDPVFHARNECIYFSHPSEFCKPALEVIDCAAHELTHAVVFWGPRWVYHGESGALDESIADIFAVMLKHYLSNIQDASKANDKDWLIGEDFFLNHPEFKSYREGLALRSIKAPGSAFSDHPVYLKDTQVQHWKNHVDTTRYENPKKNDHGGVHDNAGIPSYVFYLVATKIGGPSWDLPGKIWIQAMQSAKQRCQGEDFSKYNFTNFAEDTLKETKRLILPPNKKKEIFKIIKTAWRSVGINPVLNDHTKAKPDNKPMADKLNLDNAVRRFVGSRQEEQPTELRLQLPANVLDDPENKNDSISIASSEGFDPNYQEFSHRSDSLSRRKLSFEDNIFPDSDEEQEEDMIDVMEPETTLVSTLAVSVGTTQLQTVIGDRPSSATLATPLQAVPENHHNSSILAMPVETTQLQTVTEDSPNSATFAASLLGNCLSIFTSCFKKRERREKETAV